MNNEPVAWMQVHYKDGRPTKFSKVQTWEDDIPLYTHPANKKVEQNTDLYEKVCNCTKKLDLTDEEILNCMGCLPKYNSEIVDDDLIEFAKAILRKAQE
jgi:hypothetical protein